MIEKIAVHTPTKESYDRLMKAYEKKGWEALCTFSGYQGNGFEHISFENFYQGCRVSAQYPKEITVEEAIARLGQYERGQEVLVRDGNDWYERIYLETIEGAICPYVVVAVGYKDYFNNGKPFDFVGYDKIRPLEKKKTINIPTINDLRGFRPEEGEEIKILDIDKTYIYESGKFVLLP